MAAKRQVSVGGHAAAAVALLLLAGCARRPAPVLSPVTLPSPRPIVVFVPGFTGTVLRDSGSGDVIWGDGAAVLRPHDGGLRTALALDPAHDPRPPAVPAGPVLEIEALGAREDVYGTLFETMSSNGWTIGDLDRPSPGADFLVFAYDWRRDAVTSAGELSRRLEALREARGGSALHLTLVGQSFGAEVVRWLLKYGAAGLDEAERGVRNPPGGVVVDRAILLGTSAGGSLRSLRYLDQGRRYVPVVGRRFLPEVVFTYASLYADLPTYRADLFLDDEGRPLSVDVLDPAVWERFGWSIYGRAVRKRLAKRGNDPVLGDATARESYLARHLTDAKRLHRLLSDDVAGYGAVRLYLIEGSGLPTTGRAVVRRGGGLRFPSGAIDGSTVVDGDGHAPRESCLALSPQELAALARPPRFVHASHFDAVRDPAAHREILEILAAP